MKTMVKAAAEARGNHKEQLLDEFVERVKPFVRASLAEWLEQIIEPPAFGAPFWKNCPRKKKFIELPEKKDLLRFFTSRISLLKNREVARGPASQSGAKGAGWPRIGVAPALESIAEI